MALTQTVTQLTDFIRKRTDNEGTSATDRFPDTEILICINRAVYAFWRLMVESRAGNFQVSTTTINTINGTSVYALDATFYRLLNVNATVNGRKQWLVPFDENERAMLSDTNAGWSGQPFRYSLVGSNIELLPTPTAVYAVEVRYVPDPPTLLSNSSFDCVNGDGLCFIVDFASKLVAEKDQDGELASTLSGSIAELRAALATSLPNRDQNFPPRIQDVRSLARGGSARAGRGRWNR